MRRATLAKYRGRNLELNLITVPLWGNRMPEIGDGNLPYKYRKY